MIQQSINQTLSLAGVLFQLNPKFRRMNELKAENSELGKMNKELLGENEQLFQKNKDLTTSNEELTQESEKLKGEREKLKGEVEEYALDAQQMGSAYEYAEEGMAEQELSHMKETDELKSERDIATSLLGKKQKKVYSRDLEKGKEVRERQMQEREAEINRRWAAANPTAFGTPPPMSAKDRLKLEKEIRGGY